VVSPVYEKLYKLAGSLIRRHWRKFLRLRQRVQPSEETINFFLAGAVGFFCGIANLLYHLALEATTYLFWGVADDPATLAAQTESYWRFAVLTIGATIAGLTLHFGLRLIKRSLTTNILEIVVAGDGRLPLRRGLINTVASWISLSSGASIGREGSVVLLSATIASKFGQLLKLQPYQLRLLVGCGAGGGIAAAFNAPISGAVFAATIILGTFSMHVFAPLVLTSVIAAIVSRSFFGIQPWYQVPGFEIMHLSQLPWFILVGVGAGIIGAIFLKALEVSESIFGRLNWPIWGKLLIAGVAMGVIAIYVPGICGNGYKVTNKLLTTPGNDILLTSVFILLVSKMIATAVAVGAGTVGGVFTPTLFIGAALGTILGLVLKHFGHAEPIPLSAFGLVGMGSALAATTHAPLFAMIMIFEISLNYSLMPALMVGCVIAVWVSRKLHPFSVYLAPLKRRGIPIESGQPDQVSPHRQTVGDLMRAPVPPIPETASLTEIAQRFLSTSHSYLPVINTNHQLIGIVALDDLRAFLNKETNLPVIAYDIMRPPPPLITPSQNLADVLPIVLASDMRHFPVVNNALERKLVGSLARADVVAVATELLSG